MIFVRYFSLIKNIQIYITRVPSFSFCQPLLKKMTEYKS